MSSTESLGQRMRSQLGFVVLFVVGTTFLVVMALLNHRALGTGYDLGIYDQTVWNLSHGRIWMTTLVYETGGYYDHFEPILLLFVPLYWLWSDARVLLIVQSLALGLGSLPIYLYARYRFRTWEHRDLLALVIAAAYLAYPAMHNANLNDFHEVSLLPPLLGFALYGLLTGRPRVTWVFLALCLMVKEDFSVTFLMFGLFIMVFKPSGFRRRDGAIVAAIAVTWMLLVLYVFYPAATRGMPYPFVERRYPWLGDSPESAAKVLLTQPWIMLPYLTQAPKLLFVLRLMGPLVVPAAVGLARHPAGDSRAGLSDAEQLRAAVVGAVVLQSAPAADLVLRPDHGSRSFPSLGAAARGVGACCAGRHGVRDRRRGRGELLARRAGAGQPQL